MKGANEFDYEGMLLDAGRGQNAYLRHRVLVLVAIAEKAGLLHRLHGVKETLTVGRLGIATIFNSKISKETCQTIDDKYELEDLQEYASKGTVADRFDQIEVVNARFINNLNSSSLLSQRTIRGT